MGLPIVRKVLNILPMGTVSLEHSKEGEPAQVSKSCDFILVQLAILLGGCQKIRSEAQLQKKVRSAFAQHDERPLG